jgi:small-conductance mechanosensitive channel
VDALLDYRLFRIGDTSVTTGSLAVSLLLLVGSYILARLVRSLVTDRLLARTHVSRGLRSVLGRFSGYLVFFFGAAIALQTLGVRATTLTAFGAAVGVGVGLGLQDVVRNFVAGLILLIERPFRVGDRIESGGLTAEVMEIRPRATILRTNDDIHLVVPNAKLTESTIVNRSFDGSICRSSVPVGVSYASDPRAVESALLEAASLCEGVLADPPPVVRFKSFGDSALNFELLYWSRTMASRPGALSSALHFRVHDTLTRRGIELPYPQRDIHIRTVPDFALPSGRGEGPEAGAATRGRRL